MTPSRLASPGNGKRASGCPDLDKCTQRCSREHVFEVRVKRGSRVVVEPSPAALCMDVIARKRAALQDRNDSFVVNKVRAQDTNLIPFSGGEGVALQDAALIHPFAECEVAS